MSFSLDKDGAVDVPKTIYRDSSLFDMTHIQTFTRQQGSEGS